MKVLIICTEKLPLPSIRGGAIQTYIDGALPTLKQRHDITVLGTTDPSLPEEEIIDGIRYVRIPGGIHQTYRKGVISFLESNPSFDLIHIFNRPRLVNIVRENAPKSRIILSMHNDMFKPGKISSEEAALAIEQVDTIITISNYIGEAITAFYPQAAPKLRTIYSGVDLDRFVPSYSKKGKLVRKRLRKQHNLKDKKVILYAGRLSRNKSPHLLVKALPELAKYHPDIALVLMGGKWFSDDRLTDYIGYLRAISNCAPVPVIATGFVAPDKIQEWFTASDIFVCTSQWQEPLARVHYEAMASGLPIVTTNRGGNIEVIGENKNGLIVNNPEEPSEFAKHISYLLSNPGHCLEMGKCGRKLAEEKYSWNRVVSDILSVWDEVESNINSEGVLLEQRDDLHEESKDTNVDTCEETNEETQETNQETSEKKNKERDKLEGEKTDVTKDNIKSKGKKKSNKIKKRNQKIKKKRSLKKFKGKKSVVAREETSQE